MTDLPIAIRPAVFSDVGLLLEWRNDPATRSQSLTTAPIAMENHARWLEDRLSQANDCRLWIAETAGRPIGQARIDRREARTGEISISLDAGERGRGFGSTLIALATERGMNELQLDRVIAVIKVGNEASVAAFRRAGYDVQAHEQRGSDEVLVLERRLS
jgi:UDP-2,4-diacetamido-2,4,6-trideoxy-beta-L-altropyranose hydrolase